MLLRLLRAAVVALAFSSLFKVSREATLARGGEDLPGISWTLGVLAAIFLTAAAVSERLQGPETNLRKDILWGLGIGSIVTIIVRW